jgi:hypothetical protein
VSEHTELFTEWLAYRRVDSTLHGTYGSPHAVHANIFIKVGRIVECEAFKAFETCRELVKLGETTPAFLLDADFDLTDPSSLHLYALRDHFFLQPVKSE